MSLCSRFFLIAFLVPGITLSSCSSSGDAANSRAVDATRLAWVERGLRRGARVGVVRLAGTP